MRRCLALAVLVASLWALPPGAGARAEKAYGVVHEETVIHNRWGDPMKAYLAFPTSGGKKVDGRHPVVLTLTYFPSPTWEQSTAQFFQEGWDVAGFNLARDVDLFVRHGYVFAAVNWPGTGGSAGGEFTFDRKLALSGYDAVEWLGTQPWSSGKVGMYGGSGNGLSQLKTAEQQPPHLTTIIPAVAPTDAYEDVAYRGGMPASSEDLMIAGLVGSTTSTNCTNVPDSGEEAGYMAGCVKRKAETNEFMPKNFAVSWREHPQKDAYWDEWVIDVDRITVPFWSWGGWDDHFLRGNVNLYITSRQPQKMLAVGFDGHSMGPTFDPVPEAIRWYDYWLKGEDTGIGREMADCPVRYFLQQALAWHCASAWPPATARTTPLYLGGAGGQLRLTSSPPVADGSDTYRYLPTQGLLGGEYGFLRRSRPNSSESDNALTYNDASGGGDQRVEEVTSLMYVGEPLTHDQEVSGLLSADLFASSTATDTDWVVKLVDVFPDSPGPAQPGYRNLVTTGWLKGTHRNGHVTPEPVPPGQVVHYQVELLPTAYLFKADHRIAVMISSADASRTWPNETAATNTVHRGRSAPSRILLPVSDATGPIYGGGR